MATAEDLVKVHGFTKQAENAIRRVLSRMTEIGQSRACELPSSASSCYPDNKEGHNHHIPEVQQDHSALRYVDILDALLRIWEEKRALKVAGISGPRECDPCLSAHVESRASSSTSGQYSATGATSLPPPYPHPTSTGSTARLPQPQQQQQQPVYLDLNILGTELFSDAAASFTWDSLGTIDWSAMGGMGGI